jgi:hypothetical protein
MVVDDMLGVVKLALFVNKQYPPDDAEYQVIVSPALRVAEMVTVPVPQREALPAVGALGTALIVAVTAVLLGETQPVVVFESNA